jgi:hypothetical protein
MSKRIALTVELATALAPAAAVAQVSGGYVGAPLPSLLAAPHVCDGAQGATPIDRLRVARMGHRNAHAPIVSRSCCVTGMCTEGGGF